MKLLYTIFFILYVFMYQSFAQDSLFISNKKNTIRWDPTPMFLVGPKSVVLGYERIISPFQSASINIGTLVKKPFTDEYGNTIHLLDESHTGGMLLSLDYRFYFKKRNKKPAPDGIYWGPYFSYYNIWFEGKSEILKNGISVNTVYIDADLKMINLGMQLGYQFVIKDRFTIDLILMGPSYSFYSAKIKFAADIQLNEDSEFYEDIKKLLASIAPGLNTILDEQSLDSSGRLKFGYYGFRYFVQFGYLF